MDGKNGELPIAGRYAVDQDAEPITARRLSCGLPQHPLN